MLDLSLQRRYQQKSNSCFKLWVCWTLEFWFTRMENNLMSIDRIIWKDKSNQFSSCTWPRDLPIRTSHFLQQQKTTLLHRKPLGMLALTRFHHIQIGFVQHSVWCGNTVWESSEKQIKKDYRKHPFSPSNISLLKPRLLLCTQTKQTHARPE